MSMTAKVDVFSAKRLLRKIAKYIGKSCFLYISRLCENDSLSSVDLEILERVFTIGFYSDEVIERACFAALNLEVTNVVEFTFLTEGVSAAFCKPDP